MKRYRCLKETTDRRTYNLVKKNLYAVCARCAWHPSFWRSCYDNPYADAYKVDGSDLINNPPNWKLVSKNRKQWMKKRFIKVKRKWEDGVATFYGW